MFIVKLITEADIPEAIEVLNSALGEDFVSSSDLLSIINDKIGVAYKILDSSNNKIVGVATGMLAHSQNEFNYYLNGFEEQLDTHIAEGYNFPIIVIKSVAVLKDYTGLGIGTSLVKELINWGILNQSKFVFSIGWTDEEGCHIEKIFTRLGLTQVIQINNFWFKDSLELQYACPSCGNPCYCSAILFGKSLE